jgi:hypothetical protein
MSSKTWQIAVFVLALVAVGAGMLAYTQHNAVTALTAQLAAATKDAEQAHNEATAKLTAEARPDLPVSLSFRRALLSAGLVGVFRNTSANELEFTLDLDSAATGRHVRKAVVLNPNSVLEIGAQQGWAFALGQRVTLNNPAYRPASWTVGG